MIKSAISGAAACLCAICAQAQDLSGGLPMPVVPDSITQDAKRADYMLAHFWDAMDFSNRKYALDDTFMELAMQDFAQWMASADSANMRKAVDALMHKASADKDAYNKLADVARLILFDEESPQYDEGLYRYFATALLSGNMIGDANRSRLEYSIEMIDKNAPGSAVGDFRVIGRDGNEHSLVEIISGVPALLVFYDPDCEDCHKAFQRLVSLPEAQNLVADGKLKIVAIADFDTRERWDEEPLELPEGWIDCCDVTGIQDEELYIITHTPTLYWIGADGKVALKNRGLNEMISRIQSLNEE